MVFSGTKEDCNDRKTCPECNDTFANIYALNKHLKKCRQIQYSCSQCSATFKKRQLLKRHQIEAHPKETERPFQCEQCDERFPSSSNLAQHKKTHQGHGCKLCPLKFQKWTELRSHISKDHKKVHKCSVCHKKFDLRANLKSHFSTHEDERTVFHCPYPMCPR